MSPNPFATVPKNTKKLKKKIIKEVMSEPRLQIRSLEHFCDAIEVNYLNVWSVSFKIVSENVVLCGFNHFPIFRYQNSYC